MTTIVRQREYSETVPVQYQDGFVSFMGLKIKVDPRVLIPRPETEILVRAAAKELARLDGQNYKVMDMCTGSGAIAIAMASLLPGAEVKAADISSEALEVARENVGDAGFADRIELMFSDMFSCFAAEEEASYDAIVSNPPYVSDKDFELLDAWVKAEPALALYAGKRGMDYLDILCAKSGRFLKDGGFLALEIGYDQSIIVMEKMTESGFSGMNIVKDDNGYSRVIIGWKNG